MRALLPFFAFMCALMLQIPAAFADSPVPVSTDEPVFLKTSTSRHYVESNQQLNVYFNIDSKRCKSHYGQKNSYRACNRDLGLKGKRITDGIAITPAIKGVWRWENDRRISFTPDGYWQAGTAYTAVFDLNRMGVPAHVQLTGTAARRTSVNISARALRPEISQLSFMQDPDDPARKLVTARLTTNYPVTRDTLTQRIGFALEEADGKSFKTTDDDIPFDITYHNDASTSAALSVALDTLPDKDRYMWLRVDRGVVPMHGGANSSAMASERVRVPGLHTWLAVDDVSTAIMRADNGAPRQVATLNLNVKTAPAALLDKAAIYLLPARHPTQNIRAQKDDADDIYEWKGANEVSPEIRDMSEFLTIGVGKDDTMATQFALGYTAPPGRYILLEVAAGLESFGGFTLEKTYRKVMRVPDHPHDIKIMHEGSILPLNGERKLSLHARGTDRLDVEVAHIQPDSLHHFISQTGGDIRQANFNDWRFGTDDIADIQTKSIPVIYNNPRESQYAGFDFAPYMKDGRKGLFVLNIRGFKDDKPVGQRQRRFVLVTDMGLLVKQNADKTRPIYVVSFSTGKPVEGADISVLGRNGQVLHAAKTGPGGTLTLPDMSHAIREETPVAIVAQKGADFAFIPYARRDRALNYSRFSTGGNRPLAAGLNAHAFSDRGIYRPGETAHIGFILKNADWSALPEQLPLRIVISDPQGNEVLDRVTRFGTDGLRDVSLETGHGWLTGRYHAGLYLARDGKRGDLLGATTFKVEEFQPDRLKIDTGFTLNGDKLDKPRGWVKPGGLAARLVLKNLYGTPASNRRATAHMRLHPEAFYFDDFKDYSFFDATPAQPRQIDVDLPDTQTDENGSATFNLDLEKQAQGSYAVSVEMRGFEANSGRGVTAYDGLRVSPMDYIVGYKADSNIGWLKKGSTAKALVIAVSPALAQMPVDNLHATLVRKAYASTLVKRGDGTYAYDSVPRYEDITTHDFTIQQDGTDLAIPTDEIGEFLFRIADANGRVVAKIPFGVTGTGQRAAGLDREAVLDVKPDKTQYDPGSAISLQITAPYTGAGLITLESDRVIAHKWFRTSQTDTVQTITVPEDFIGKGYINVAFVRDVKSREIYMSPLSYAVVPFTATPDARRVNISLKTAEEIKPGELVDITYSADKPGKAIIYAVDEGILQVARYTTPDPVDFFLLNRALQVETTQMLDLLMPEYTLVRELSKQGGGAAGAGGMLQQHLNPFRRKTLAPAVFWSGIVDLTTAEQTLSWRVPGHFNGTLRLMAVAVSNDAVGATSQNATVRGDIVLTPNLPLTMAPGDIAEASVTIANATQDAGKDAQFAISLAPSAQLEIVTGPDAPVTITAGSEKTVSFRIRATDTLGGGSLVITARSGALEQSAEATLSVRPPVARSTRMGVGYAEKGAARITIGDDFYPTLAERELSFSPLPAAYISGLAKYLDGYPYGCTEQLLSRNFPKLSLYGLPEFGVQEDEMHDAVENIIAMLRRRATRDGGFSMWYGQHRANEFITIYAVDFLTRAQDAGIAVPDELVGKSLRHIRDYVNTRVHNMQDARHKAYGIYLLTLNGIVTTNEILHLMKYLDAEKDETWSGDITAAYLAASFDLLQQKDMARDTLTPFIRALTPGKMSYQSAGWENPYHNPFISHARGISIMARHFPGALKKLDQDIILRLAGFVREQRYNTLSAAIGIQALRDYIDVAGDALSDAQWAVLVDGVPLDLPPPGRAALAMDIPVTAGAVDISARPQQAFFYTMTMSGFLKNLPAEPVTNGLEITRNFETPEGENLSGPVKIGDVIEAVITLRAHGDTALENIAVVDLLPGGFALERDSVGENSTLTTDFTDKREDRVIAFATATTHPREFRYRIRAVSKGVFTVPPPYAESMYDLSKQAMGHAGKITVISASE